MIAYGKWLTDRWAELQVDPADAWGIQMLDVSLDGEIR